MMNLLEVPDKGQHFFEGRSYFPDEGRRLMRQRRLRELRSSIGMVFPRFNLYPHLSALDNVTLALHDVKGLKRKDAREKAEQRLTQVGLKNRGHHRHWRAPVGKMQ